MSWGIFERYGANGRITEIHIVPCNLEGKPYIGHEITCFCGCCPDPDPEISPGNPPVFHHHQLH